MTPERLAHIKGHILNPASASLNREWMMELVEELERAQRILAIPSVAAAADEDARQHYVKAVYAKDVETCTPPETTLRKLIDEQHYGGATPAVIDDRPTPPEAPKAKKGRR